MARFVKDIPFSRSLMVVNVIMGAPFLVKEGTQLLSGENSIVERGWKQTATVNYAWANPDERDNLQEMPEFGLDTLFPTEDGWVHEEPQVSEIEDTIHYYNISVSASRFTRNKPI